METNSTRPAKRRRVVQSSNDEAAAAAAAAAAEGKETSVPDALDLSVFLNSLQVEIKDLHASVKASKDSRAEKAFQRLPRSMRRRTASHNAKRLPRRLRQQAKRDQAADNTPSVAVGRAKRKEARPASAWVYEKTKQRVKRQQEKKMAALRAGDDAMETDSADSDDNDDDEDPMETDNDAMPEAVANTPLPIDALKLPTHLWHAKRAHLASPGPLWHAVVAKTPANKTYRASLRSAGLRPGACLSWDTSYMAVVQLTAAAAAQVEAALSAVVEPHLLLAASLRSGTRCVDVQLPRAFAYQHGLEASGVGRCGAMTLFFRPGSGEAGERAAAFLRVHPTLFAPVWAALASHIEQQKLPVVLHDLRLEVGSIDVTGSSAVAALQTILRPHRHADDNNDDNDNDGLESHAADFLQLRRLDATGLSPTSGALLAFDVQDPRLDEPDGLLDSLPPLGQQALADWPPHHQNSRRPAPSGLFDETRRKKATWLVAQAVLDRRRGKLPVGRKLLATADNQPIPVILTVPGTPAGPTTTTTASVTWTLLAPRGCIDVLWRCLHHHCLPGTGRRPLYAGLDEARVVALERGQPWFPADFPGTPTGWDWELRSRADETARWHKKPPAKRPQWATLDLGGSGGGGQEGKKKTKKKGEVGSGFACDWEVLFGTDPVPLDPAVDNEDNDSSAARFAALQPPSQPPIFRDLHHVAWAHVRAAVVAAHLHRPPPWPTTPACPLLTVSLDMLGRGTPQPRARIYRLPADGPLRAKWLDLAGPQPKKNPTRQKRIPPGADLATRKTLLARSLLEVQLPLPLPLPDGTAAPAQLPIPDAADLLGFVTSGAQRFQTGRGFGIGHVSAPKLVDTIVQASSEHTINGQNGQNGQNEQTRPLRLAKEARLCIVRNAGEPVGWLARWTAL